MADEQRKRRSLRERFARIKIDKMPPAETDLHITNEQETIVADLDATNIRTVGQLNEFRRLAEDRQTVYAAYDDMRQDSIIAAALEIYADDATVPDEQGRILWVESESQEIKDSAERLIDILELQSRCWKHIYLACQYGDYYLKLFRYGEIEDTEDIANYAKGSETRIHNDKQLLTKNIKGKSNYIEYVEDVPDPACMFDLRKRGKTSGFIEISKEIQSNFLGNANTLGGQLSFTLNDIDVYLPDRFVHIMLGENLSRVPEEITIEMNGAKITYQSARGKSILQDVYPIQKELQLLEDSLLLNRLTRSSLIRILEIEMGDMPKNEVNSYLRRVKNLIEQHIALDKDEGNYKSFNAPGPIDNVIYVPVRNGKGSISVNNLGGDVNIRDIADIDYFNNKRAGALKIPRQFLGDDGGENALGNGGSLTRMSIRYARTIRRIQQSYIRAVTQLLNLFFLDKGLDYVNKFTVRMASPSTQEDLERNELIESNASVVDTVMSFMDSLEGDTQKKVLEHMLRNILKMPEVADIVAEDQEEDVDIDGNVSGGGMNFDTDINVGGGPGNDFENDLDSFGSSASEVAETDTETETSDEGGFTDAEFAEFQDEL